MRRLWRRLFGRGAAPPASIEWAALAAPQAYDVLIALTPHLLSVGVRPAAAIPAVRAPLQAIEGVGWVSVEYHPAPSSLRWLEVFAPGGGYCQGEPPLPR